MGKLLIKVRNHLTPDIPKFDASPQRQNKPNQKDEHIFLSLGGYVA